jgi:hypothetical protein
MDKRKLIGVVGFALSAAGWAIAFALIISDASPVIGIYLAGVAALVCMASGCTVASSIYEES